MYSQNDYRSYELYHHGVLGQKHGVRNGPPYPLDASDHSASEKKAGWQKSLDGGSDSDKKKVSRPETVAERKNRIETGIKEANKADKLDAKAFKALDKGKYDKAEKLFDKSASINKLAQAKLADASFDEIQLGERFLREKRSMIVATVIGTALAGPIGGAASGAATYAVNAVSKEGRLARKMQREIDAENREKYLKEKEENNAIGKATVVKDPAQSVAKSMEQYKKDVEKANKAKTDEEHDKLNREADEKYAKAAAETRQYYKDNKDRLLKNAKEKDQYDMEFLERSNPDGEWDNKRYISEYEKYLDDPYSYQPYEYRKNK